MKRRFLAGTAMLVAVALPSTACGVANSETEGTYELKFASYNVPDAAEAEATAAWAEEVSEVTDGRVTIEFYYQESLLSGVDTLRGVGDGLADMGFIADAYYPAELPLTTVVGIPFVTSDAEAQGRAFIDLYENNDEFAAEWEEQGVHVLLWAPVPSSLIALKEPAEAVDDLRGRKIRGYGYLSRALEEAGASAVGISQSEVYEALQRGVIEGTSGASLDIAGDRDFQEVAPHYLDANTGNYAITANVINREVWDSMPDDIRAAITDLSKGYLDDYLSQLAEVEDTACTELLDAGGDITVLSEDATREWGEAAQDEIKQRWVDAVDRSSSSADAEEFYGEYVDVLNRYEAKTNYKPAMRRCAAKQ